jgi:hypothetical protein
MKVEWLWERLKGRVPEHMRLACVDRRYQRLFAKIVGNQPLILEDVNQRSSWPIGIENRDRHHSWSFDGPVPLQSPSELCAWLTREQQIVDALFWRPETRAQAVHDMNVVLRNASRWLSHLTGTRLTFSQEVRSLHQFEQVVDRLLHKCRIHDRPRDPKPKECRRAKNWCRPEWPSEGEGWYVAPILGTLKELAAAHNMKKPETLRKNAKKGIYWICRGGKEFAMFARTEREYERLRGLVEARRKACEEPQKAAKSRKKP